jgi:hypothetical protein
LKKLAQINNSSVRNPIIISSCQKQGKNLPLMEIRLKTGLPLLIIKIEGLIMINLLKKKLVLEFKM